MIRQFTAIFCMIICLIGTAYSNELDNEFAEFTFEQTEVQDPVTFDLLHENTSIQPNKPFWVAIRLTVEDGWHSYWKNPGDAGMPPEITWDLPKGYQTGPIHWPLPKREESDTHITYSYNGEVLLLTEIIPDNNSEGEVTLRADIRWMACSSSSCLPGNAFVEVTIPITKADSQPHPQWKELLSNAHKNIPKKQDDISAVRQQGLIGLTLNTPINKALVQFYPENKNVIDEKYTPTISLEEQSGKAVIALKENRNISKEVDHLRGILVLTDLENPDQILDAYEIDVPLTTKNNQTIAAAEITSKGAIFSGNQDQLDSISLALMFAFLGGMILNLMPCVLPVISFKIMSFVKMSAQNRSTTFKHGLIFSLGVLISFWTIAGILIALQTYGHAVGWGFQLQEPIFVAVLATLIFVFGLSLFGVFEFGLIFTSLAGNAQNNKSDSYSGSFFSGVLATAVATPCTGPFLGTAIGFAVTLPPLSSLAIFTSIGAGMAFPYLILSAFPKLLRFLPKPGAWMETFKQAMGFLMLATVLWLVWVFSAQTSSFSLMILLFGLFIVAISCWIYGRWATPVRSRKTRKLGTLFALLVFSMGCYTITNASSYTMPEISHHDVSYNWEPFSRERIEELRNENTPVFIDFTAKWCLICQTNHLVLSIDSVDKEMEKRGVVKMKADWTRNDPVITEELRKFGRNGVPLYVLYGPNSVQILPQVLTPDNVIEALEEMDKTNAPNVD